MELSSLTKTLTLTGSDVISCDLGGLCPADRGRVAEFSLRLFRVCPERRVALSVAVEELDPDGNSYPRGVRSFTVPAHHSGGARDVEVAGLRFVLPDDLDVCGDGARRLTVRADAHYVDRNEACLLSPL